MNPSTEQVLLGLLAGGLLALAGLLVGFKIQDWRWQRRERLNDIRRKLWPDPADEPAGVARMGSRVDAGALPKIDLFPIAHEIAGAERVRALALEAGDDINMVAALARFRALTATEQEAVFTSYDLHFPNG